MIEAQRTASPSSNDPLLTAKRSYPLYDGHGNMIATLGKVGTGFDLANEKRYDAWGAVRQGEPAGSHVVNPNTQYCANLGHKFDGESDMLYMRARYYEPSTGRFISEDPARDGENWSACCNNDPVGYVDQSGKEPLFSILLANFCYLGAIVSSGIAAFMEMASDFESAMFFTQCSITSIAFCSIFNFDGDMFGIDSTCAKILQAVFFAAVNRFTWAISSQIAAVKAGNLEYSHAAPAIGRQLQYAIIIMGLILAIDFVDLFL